MIFHAGMLSHDRWNTDMIWVHDQIQILLERAQEPAQALQDQLQQLMECIIHGCLLRQPAPVLCTLLTPDNRACGL